MWRRTAAAGPAVVVVLAWLLLGGGPAAAATELTLAPASGPPGTTFVITGTGFAPGAVVKLHWGSRTGLELASGTGPDFTTTAVVPDSPPNSHPVVAVVTEGTSVSTSSASFQVTAADASATTTGVEASTTTTVANAPPTTATTEAPRSSRSTGGLGPSAPARDTAGVDGGVGGMADTTGALGAGGTAAGGGAGAGAVGAGPASTVTTRPGPAAETSTIPTLAPPPGSPAPAPNAAAAQQAEPDGSSYGDAAAGVPPASTSQSAGAVSNPALLVVGLALVFGGGVFLAVRNRQRA